MLDGVLHEWCSVCGYWTSLGKQHNSDTHISRKDAASSAASGTATTSSTTTTTGSGKAKTAALTSAIKFTEDTKAGSINAAALSNSSFPQRHRLQMIGSLFVASTGSAPSPPPPDTTSLYCLPVAAPAVASTGQTEDPTPAADPPAPVIGTCPICGEEGPENTECVDCDDPDCIYEVQYCGPCVICGDYGPTGLPCSECDSYGGVYDSPPSPSEGMTIFLLPDSPDSPPEDDARILARLPASLIAVAAASTAPADGLDVPDEQKDEEHGDDDDDASFKSASLPPLLCESVSRRI
jgi:hypothetical protein